MTNFKNIEDIYPLSPLQQGILFHSIYAPESGVYFEQLSCTLKGNLDVQAFQQAWQQVITRHQVLRTAFIWKGQSQPLQVVYRQVHLPLKIHDWQEVSNDQQQQQLSAFLRSDQEQGFQLSQAPLMRLILIQLAQNLYQFVWSHHHLLLDGWSVHLVLKEVLDFYETYTRSQDLYLEPTATYRDYIAWLQKQDKTPVEGFWRQVLQGFSAPTPLMVDRPPTNQSRESTQFGEQQIQLPKEVSATLVSFVRQHQLTLNTLVQGAWALLLSRYSGEADVVFGVTVSGRPPAIRGVESIVGLLINTLPLRVAVHDDESPISWLKQIQYQQVEMSQYEYSPLVQIQGWSEVPPGVPLFESIVVFENYSVDAALQEGGFNLEVSNVRAFEKTNYPLTLVGLPGTQLSLRLNYDTHRFDATTITRMLGHLQTLLESILAHPEQRLCDLLLLTEAEQQQLLVEWNNNRAKYPENQCIHELFEAQVERSPDAIAVVFENSLLTYGELNDRANRIAHNLQTFGVGPEVLVAICVERSLEMVVGLLAILKAGGAYVPLDPASPQERLAFMLEDAQVPVLLTQKRLLEMLPSHSARVLCLDTEDETIGQPRQENPTSRVVTNNLAYVIYTSGSTGFPKGVLVSHTNVVRLFAATQSWYHFNEQDVWTLFHSVAFDFSVWELWGALLYGGQLVVVPYLVSREPKVFYDLLCREQVTILNQTPSAFRQLTKAEESLRTSVDWNLRLVIFGGEALDIQSLKPYFERHGDQCPQLVNMYGITETTVHVTYRPLTIADLSKPGSAIGRPIPDLQIYLLDRHQQPVPIGVPGELYIGGAGLTRGYLNRPELTAERFTPKLKIAGGEDFSEFMASNHFTDNPDKRLYKSGDLARYLPNGDIEYLGRVDHQVKIRGFRIELEEIEALLSQHPRVQESVVLVREDEPGDKRLVAYVLPHPEQPPTLGELRRFLKEKLPEYMVPAAFVLLEALPLTLNGKVDRRLLPAPDTARPELEEAYQAPSTPEETVLANIWAKVLRVEQVGIHDNFFVLGGDSIRSIQVQSLAQKQGLSFSLQQMFQHQTIHELVQELKSVEGRTITPEPVQPFSLISEADRQRLPDDVEDAYPLTLLQMGMIFHSESSPDTAIYHNITSFHIKASFNLEKLQTAVEQLATRHPVLRTSFALSNFSEPLQLVHKAAYIPLQVEDLRLLSFTEQEQALANWFEAEKSCKFDWTSAPLLRFQIHRRSEATFQFSFTEHHAILDGWSVALMLTELFGHYFSVLNQEAHLIEPPPLSTFRDFVALERQAIASPECQRYWIEKLNDSTLTKLYSWPFSQRGAEVRQVGVQYVTLSPEISEKLQQMANSAGVPLKSILLAAHLRVLSLLSNQSDVVTGLVTNGRPEQTDGERILGLFLNTLPFRLQLPGGTWMDLVRQVFEAEMELLPFRRYPLAQLQQSMGGQSLFEIAFNFVHFHVYQKVLGLENVQLLSENFFGETNFTLLADFSLNPNSSQVELAFKYQVSKLGNEQIKSISGYYVETFTAMVTEPLGRYELHSLLSEQEKHQLLVHWNDTQKDYAKNLCIHELFEAQVEQTPDAVAVVFEEQQLSYRELNSRANYLAHHLRKLGVKPEVLVGICLERSVEMVIGLLAILKAGGAYVPLDPVYPPERLAFILADTQTSVLLTKQHLIEKLSQLKANIVYLNSSWETFSQESEENPVSQVRADNLAYVMYTSGSTGKPKGVAIQHRSAIALLDWTKEIFTKEDLTSVLASTSICFDLSVFELFVPLSYGGQVILTENVLHLPVLKAANYVTLINTVPSAAVELLRVNGIPPSVRTINLAGEQLHQKLVQQLYDQETVQQVFNLYGPSEDTTYSTFTLVKKGASESPPIGCPIANTQAYLLDAQMQPVPVGVSGNLYISGDGLARGYFNRPELTALAFIPNPFSDSPSARLYNTGDLGRYLPNGNIQYIGRSDHQVKIRGFRIELGEIEAVLGQHPEVLQSTVIAHEDMSGDRRLVAYLIPKQQPAPTISELRRFLEDKLLQYMIPSAFVMLEELPLTPNGKVDRLALSALEAHHPELEVAYVMPQTEVERTIATVWQKALNVENIGIYDNFFELGGHSLLLVQVNSQLRELFKTDLSILDLFRYPSINLLSNYLSEAKNQDTNSSKNDIFYQKIKAGKDRKRERLQKLKSI